VFELPYGIQLSPVFQTASARPYNLTAGSDLNRDGINNDRWIDPATGQQVSLNAGRGDPTVVLDVRGTKFFSLGGDRRIGILVEVFNLLDNVNLGGDFNGNGRSALFGQRGSGTHASCNWERACNSEADRVHVGRVFFRPGHHWRVHRARPTSIFRRTDELR
jgi:hypothetical protein